MMDVRSHMQETLDGVLSADNVRVFWQRKTDTDGADLDEYVVYTLDGDDTEAYADNTPQTRSANISVRYYYDLGLIETAAGRESIKARENAILAGLREAHFVVFNGPFDAGDIDNVGCGVALFDCYFDEVVK